MSDKVIKLINGLLFYIIWWGCVLGVKYSYNFLGPILTILAGMFHIYLIKNTKNEMKLILFVGLLGFFIESFHMHSGILSYSGYIHSNNFFPPLWIICMWLGFGGTLNYSMFWMKGRWFLMIVSGVVFGPISYLAGVKLNVLSFNFSDIFTIVILSIIWGICIPVMYYVNTMVYEN